MRRPHHQRVGTCTKREYPRSLLPRALRKTRLYTLFIDNIISFPLHTTNTGREGARAGEGWRDGETGGEGRTGGGEKIKDQEEVRLSTLSTDTTCQLDVFGHDGDTLGVDGAQVGVLKQTHQVGLTGLLQRKRQDTSSGQHSSGYTGNLCTKLFSNLKWQQTRLKCCALTYCEVNA